MMLHPMNDHHGAAAAAALGVLPFDGMGIYEQPRPRFIFKMPRVVPDQKSKFESDELFRRLSRESEVKYTGHRERLPEERQQRFINGCREGRTDIAFTATGTNLQLVFGVTAGNYSGDPRECDFNKEQGKVHIKSHLIMNGVCVMWRGWIDLERLDGVGCLEFDEARAADEDRMLREQVERWNRRGTEMDDTKHHHHHHHRAAAYRMGAAASHLNYHHHLHQTERNIQGLPGMPPAPSGVGVDGNLNHHHPHHQDPEMEVRLRAY